MCVKEIIIFRMIIYQLKMHNFKSYNGQHCLGPFDSHFNCVIGPNGNGKSNIIDAVLFVFGFKSAKLRQDNLSSLIHKSAFSQPDKASVTVVFKENNQLASFSRTITKGGNTYYKMNGQKINWNDLREKLVSKKIDLNKNLFIILQGEVERLCQLSPETMVDYLEYVSGSDQLKQPIQIGQKRYVEVSIVKQQARMNVSVKRKLFESINQKALELTARIFVRFRISILQHLVIKKMIFNNHHNLRKLRVEQTQKLKIIKQIQEELKLVDCLISKKRQQILGYTKQTDRVEKNIASIQSSRQKVSLVVKDAQREISFLNVDKDKKNQQNKRYELELAELNNIYEQQKSFIHKIKSMKQKLSNQKQLPKLKICCQLQTKLTALRQETAALTGKITEKQIRLTQNRQKLSVYNKKQKQYKLLKQSHRAKLRQIKAQRVQTNQKLKQAKQTIQQIQRQIKNKPNSTMAATSNKQKLINEIRSANKFKILCPEVVLVTLREIVILDSTYREVIETILPQLDFFIVDSFKQAKQVSDYLKKKQLGRMTFLIKELINQIVTDAAIIQKSPNQTKLIIDLIKCTNQDAKNILIWALGNTLVTNQLDTAMKVAYYDQKRYRVITTSGQFIDSSGTITKLALQSSKQDDHQFMIKKVEAMKRLENNLVEKIAQMDKQEKEICAKVLSIEEEERAFDGLDQVILDQLQKQIANQNNLVNKNKTQINIFGQNLVNIKIKLQQSSFQIDKYKQIIDNLIQIDSNQQKIKKVQNFDQLANNLKQKQSKITVQINQISRKMQAKMKAKVTHQTEIQKQSNLIQIQRQIINSINSKIFQIQKQLRDIEQQRQKLLNKIGDGNRKMPNASFRDQLLKLKNTIKSMDYDQLQLKNKLHESIKQILEFANLICKSVYQKYPELIPKIQQEKSLENLPRPKSSGIEGMFQEHSVLRIGKANTRFVETLSSKQKQFLFQHSARMLTIYNSQNDIRPQSSELDIFLDSIDIKQIKFSHSFQQQRLKHLQKDREDDDIAAFDFQLFNEYRDNKMDFESVQSKLTRIEGELSVIKDELISLRHRRLQIFMNSFNQINFELNSIYTRLTGGKAQLNFIDSMNPFEGVQFSVRPVNKSWKRVNLLSGGEKTFTSLALIFACEQIKKFPFYFMDQIDAALDYKNTSLLAEYIKGKTGTQHIVISLRKNMYQECNRVVGIYKVQDQSRTFEMEMSQLKRQVQQ